MKRYQWWLIGGTFVAMGILAALIGWYADASVVRVRFFDVGQGDAILISQGTNQILIDGGRDEKTLLSRLGRALPFWDRDIETVILTHPDEDHVGGLRGLSGAYRVGQWLTTGAETDTETWRRLHDQMTPETVVRAGTVIKLNATDTLTILWPRADTVLNPKDTNAGSIVARLDLGGEKTFLLTGDLPSEEEQLIVVDPTTVLKAGHHGSKYSTSDEWLDRVQPIAAILSVGAKNRYGHPAAETLERLAQHRVTVYRTDRQGTITYTCAAASEQCSVAVER